MTEPNQPGQLPQSQALAEAKVDSLSELLATDPEKLTAVQELQVIEALRAQRARWEAGQTARKEGKAKKAATPKSAKTILQSVANVDDLGL